MEVECYERKIAPLILMHYTEYDKFNESNGSTSSTTINTVNTLNTNTNKTNNITINSSNININEEISNNTIDFTLLFKNKCKTYHWIRYCDSRI